MFLNNCCRFIGSLVHDIELHHTTTEVPVLSFTLAVKRETPDTNGEWGTDFIKCTAWRQQAEKISKSYQKGDLLTVLGRLQMHSTDDGNGHILQTAEVIVCESRKILSADTRQKEITHQGKVKRNHPAVQADA